MGIEKSHGFYYFIDHFFFSGDPKPHSISGSRLLAFGKVVHLFGEP
jgi:hypothetical protein